MKMDNDIIILNNIWLKIFSIQDNLVPPVNYPDQLTDDWGEYYTYQDIIETNPVYITLSRVLDKIRK